MKRLLYLQNGERVGYYPGSKTRAEVVLIRPKYGELTRRDLLDLMDFMDRCKRDIKKGE